MKSAASTPPYSPQSPALVSQTRLHLLVAPALEYLRFVAARNQQRFVATFVVENAFPNLRPLPPAPEAYATFVNFLKSPLRPRARLISYFFVVFHSITWSISPPAPCPSGRRQETPGFMIFGPNFVAWFVISAVIAWLLMRG